MIENLIKQAANELKAAHDERKSGRIFQDISFENFQKLIKLNAEVIMIKRGNSHKIEFTNNQIKLLKILRDYLAGVGSFNPGKGVLILGKNGTGKTLILLSFIKLIMTVSNKHIIHTHSKALPELLRQQNDNHKYFASGRSFYIEDVGKEKKEIKHYGTLITPFPDFIDAIYSNSYGLHLACSNYSLKRTLETNYGKTITSRIVELYNIHVLEGEDMRR